MDVRSLITDYLKGTQQMQLSTCLDNQPWTCTVYYAYDENLDLYWLSRPERRHSREIEANPNVSGTIVKQHTYGEKVRGIQFVGKAKKLTGIEAVHGMKVYSGRYSTPRERVNNILAGANGEKHVVYKIIPSQYQLFDEVNFPQNPTQILQL